MSQERNLRFLARSPDPNLNLHIRPLAPGCRINVRPLVADANDRLAVRVLADHRMDAEEHVFDTRFGEDASDQPDPLLRLRKHRQRALGRVVQGVRVEPLGRPHDARALLSLRLEILQSPEHVEAQRSRGNSPNGIAGFGADWRARHMAQHVGDGVGVGIRLRHLMALVDREIRAIQSDTSERRVDPLDFQQLIGHRLPIEAVSDDVGRDRRKRHAVNLFLFQQDALALARQDAPELHILAVENADEVLNHLNPAQQAVRTTPWQAVLASGIASHRNARAISPIGGQLVNLSLVNPLQDQVLRTRTRPHGAIGGFREDHRVIGNRKILRRNSPDPNPALGLLADGEIVKRLLVALFRLR